MVVLQINAVGQTSSTGRNCKEISEYINQNTEHQCYTAFAAGIVDEWSYMIGNKIEHKLHGLMSRVTGKQAYFSKNETRKLIKYIQNISPNIVVLGNLHGNYINFPMIMEYLNKKSIPVVAVLHDCWFYTGKCCHYTVDNCYRWKQQCGNCPSLKKYNKSWFFDKTTDMLNDKKKYFNSNPRLGVVGVSEWITQEAKKSPVFKYAKEMTRIYNWIDMDIFYPRRANSLKERLMLSDKQIILCVASGWSRNKGLDTIIHISEMLEEYQKLIIIGDINEKVDFGKGVIHLPTTSSMDMLAEYYSIADVFIQPSLEETFGKVSAEALACGTPLVCFDSTANPELIGEGCGKIVKVGDIDGMYAAINQILEKGKDFYSNNCINFAKKNFEKETNIKQYISLFERLINNI